MQEEAPAKAQEIEGTVTKAEIVEHLYEEMGLNRREAKDIVDMFFEEICLTLESGRVVKLSSFGNFEVRWKNERLGRNPKTGQDISIKARRVVMFRAGQKLKARVAAYAGSIE